MAVDYNDLLYEKAQKEYDDLIAELKELPSEQVIERAYEKVIKENILCILEDSQRDQKEAKTGRIRTGSNRMYPRQLCCVTRLTILPKML